MKKKEKKYHLQRKYRIALLAFLIILLSCIYIYKRLYSPYTFSSSSNSVFETFDDSQKREKINAKGYLHGIVTEWTLKARNTSFYPNSPKYGVITPLTSESYLFDNAKNSKYPAICIESVINMPAFDFSESTSGNKSIPWIWPKASSIVLYAASEKTEPFLPIITLRRAEIEEMLARHRVNIITQLRSHRSFAYRLFFIDRQREYWKRRYYKMKIFDKQGKCIASSGYASTIMIPPVSGSIYMNTKGFEAKWNIPFFANSKSKFIEKPAVFVRLRGLGLLGPFSVRNDKPVPIPHIDMNPSKGNCASIFIRAPFMQDLWSLKYGQSSKETGHNGVLGTSAYLRKGTRLKVAKKYKPTVFQISNPTKPLLFYQDLRFTGGIELNVKTLENNKNNGKTAMLLQTPSSLPWLENKYLPLSSPFERYLKYPYTAGNPGKINISLPLTDNDGDVFTKKSLSNKQTIARISIPIIPAPSKLQAIAGDGKVFLSWRKLTWHTELGLGSPRFSLIRNSISELENNSTKLLKKNILSRINDSELSLLKLIMKLRNAYYSNLLTNLSKNKHDNYVSYSNAWRSQRSEIRSAILTTLLSSRKKSAVPYLLEFMPEDCNPTGWRALISDEYYKNLYALESPHINELDIKLVKLLEHLTGISYGIHKSQWKIWLQNDF